MLALSLPWMAFAETVIAEINLEEYNSPTKRWISRRVSGEMESNGSDVKIIDAIPATSEYSRAALSNGASSLVRFFRDFF